MEIQLFNGLHDRLETFKPIQPGKVNMYVCGPTVPNLVTHPVVENDDKDGGEHRL